MAFVHKIISLTVAIESYFYYVNDVAFVGTWPLSETASASLPQDPHWSDRRTFTPHTKISLPLDSHYQEYSNYQTLL